MARPSIEVAAHAGVCYGVERALDHAYGAAQSAPKPVRTLGPLIHNPIVVDELAEGGIAPVDELDGATSGSVIIRAHGVVPSVIDDSKRRGLHVIDATCPYVKRVHRAAEKLVREGYQLIVVGESGHPEVEGIMGHADDTAVTVSCVDDLASVELQRRVGVVVQTTQTVATLTDIVDELLIRSDEVRVINTEQLKREGQSAVDERELIGFIRGILAGNHDIESFYIDGAHRMLARSVAEMEDFFTDIYQIAKNTDTRFILTVSENEENFPEFLKKYQAEE